MTTEYIPIIIVCFNNGKYVKQMVEKIIKTNPEYQKDIIIMNNSSDDKYTLNYLNICNVKVINRPNVGPWICAWKNQDIYDVLPDKFIVSDADLELNKDLPSNFVKILSDLSEKYKKGKVGFAISIDDKELMFQEIFIKETNSKIYEHEETFWKNKITEEKEYEIYNAAIDTTFTLINKKYYVLNCIRVAGNMTCRHLPYYVNDGIMTYYDSYEYYKKSKFSTTSRIYLPYFKQNFVEVTKNNTSLLIKNNPEDKNFNFWTTIYSNWEKETFEVFDKCLNPYKVCIDLGAWVGTTSIYMSRYSKHVYAVEADPQALISLKENIKMNSDNITVIDKPIYCDDNVPIKFGTNSFLKNSSLNDSTSQIKINDNNNGDFSLNTITIDTIITKYNINYNDISLIKVDIEGGEEHILHNLFELHRLYGIKLYISFHLSWWSDKNIRRFKYLAEVNCRLIEENPFVSILF
jgi:FkbM family methyltransferase